MGKIQLLWNEIMLMLYLASEIAKGGFGLGKGIAGLVMGWFARLGVFNTCFRRLYS